jgi:hypothetical protein
MRVYEGEPLLLGGQLRPGVTLNPVNTQGTMGAGVAKIFKYFYPNMNKVYERVCGAGLMHQGVLVYRPYRSTSTIANVPTKNHWQQLSTEEIIGDSVQTLIEGSRALKLDYDKQPLNTVLLGGGLGGMNKDMARRLLFAIEKRGGISFNLYNGEMSTSSYAPVETFDGEWAVYDVLGNILQSSSNFLPKEPFNLTLPPFDDVTK